MSNLHTQLPRDVQAPPAAAPLTRQPGREPSDDLQGLMPVVSTLLVITLLLGAAAITVAVSPGTLPSLITSLTSSEANGFWFLSRSAAFVSFALMWWSMALGLAITNRMARVWPGGPTVTDLHEHASLLGVAFGLVHALALLGDHYIGYSLTSIFVPFADQAYRTFAVGLGQIGLYLLVMVTFSFYVRRAIGARAWRLIHSLSFAGFALALAHGVLSGTDTANLWARLVYVLSAMSIVALTTFRVLVYPRKAR